jgi:ABC-type antimicrobial peptide transport system permease subunit
VAAARTREIGLRVALGASAGQIRRLVLAQGLRPIAGGVAVGLVAAYFASRLVRAFLIGVTPGDPVTLVAVTTLLCVVALLATYLPARRAARIDPVRVLREQ